MKQFPIIDADGHVTETLESLKKHLKPEYRNRPLMTSEAWDRSFGGTLGKRNEDPKVQLTDMDLDGIPDAEGALAWAQETLPDDPILLWGSGMSADFVIVMAANDPEGIAGVLDFSPPSTLTYTDEAEAASRTRKPRPP